MNIKQEGLGYCKKCSAPLMEAIGQGNLKGVCFGCMADSEPKTGRTVVVKEESPTMSGGVSVSEVGGGEVVKNLKPAIVDGLIIYVTLDELSNGIIPTLLSAAYKALDDMPPPPTLRETKQAIKLQEQIEALIKKQNRTSKGEVNEQ